MKFIKQTFIITFILATIGILFRGWLYRHLVTYKSIGLRPSYPAKAKNLIAYIGTNTTGETNPNIEEIVENGLSITSGQLRFTASKNEIDPNKLINSRTAHCVGYASFYATTCHYLLKKYNLSGQWIIKKHIGQLYFLGKNIHKYLRFPFFKDHDFVTIENKKTGEIFAVDPTVNDYFLIDRISYENSN